MPSEIATQEAQSTNPRYVVIGEHSLGYVVRTVFNLAEVQRLGTSIVRGGEPLPSSEGPRLVDPDTLRDAARDDFDTYRVLMPKGAA